MNKETKEIIDTAILCNSCGTYFNTKIPFAEACVCPHCHKLHVFDDKEEVKKKVVKK